MSLVQIFQGVENAQKDDSCESVIAPERTSISGECVSVGPYLVPISMIEFDVAVTVEESSSAGGGAKLSVFSIGVGCKVDSASSVSTVLE